MTTKTERWQDITKDSKHKYNLYLCSREWAEKREAVRERARDRCERCRRLKMDACHHLTYERKYAESLDDLQAICDHCHAFTHGKSTYDPLQQSRSLFNYLLDCGASGTKAVPEGFLFGLSCENECNKSHELFAIETVFRLNLVAESRGNCFSTIANKMQSALGIDFAYLWWLECGRPMVNLHNGLDCLEMRHIVLSICEMATVEYEEEE